MDKEKKDLSFILILLSTLIGMAVLFQWAIINRFYEPEMPRNLGKTDGQAAPVPFPLCDTDSRTGLSLSIPQAGTGGQEVVLYQFDLAGSYRAGSWVQPGNPLV